MELLILKGALGFLFVVAVFLVGVLLRRDAVKDYQLEQIDKEKELDRKSDIARAKKNAKAKEIKLKHQKEYEANISGNTPK